jgi:hypothetical protein
MKTVRQEIWGHVGMLCQILKDKDGGERVPKSLTSTALLFLTPVSWTVMSAPLGIAEPSLPFVTLKRWIENLEALAISS